MARSRRNYILPAPNPSLYTPPIGVSLKINKNRSTPSRVKYYLSCEKSRAERMRMSFTEDAILGQRGGVFSETTSVA